MAVTSTLVLAVLALETAGCRGPTPRWAKSGSGNARPSWAGAGSPADGRQVLARGREMVNRGEIIPGGCWDYINAVYNRAGFPADRRQTVFKTAKKGPYADVRLIRPGDWIYFVNHSYGGIEHSAIFVEWINAGAREAKMLSYAGEKRREPARYLPYVLSNVYGIIRPKP